jgi:GATA-binding protein
LLRDSIFPTWKDDAAGEELDSPDEMQKKDPLATQIWRLYSKTKKQLPNQERMENLTWRMMAMSLRKRKQEEAARYVLRKAPYCEGNIVSDSLLASNLSRPIPVHPVESPS